MLSLSSFFNTQNRSIIPKGYQLKSLVFGSLFPESSVVPLILLGKITKQKGDFPD